MVKLLITLILAGVASMSVYGQQIKRNANGDKMVRSIKVDYITKDGKVSPQSFNDIYTFDYFPNGELQSAKHSWSSDEGRITNRIFIEDDKLHFASTINGKKDSNVGGQGNLTVRRNDKTGEKSYSVNSITKSFKELVYGELKYFREVTMFANGRVYILTFDGTRPLDKEIAAIRNNPHSLVESEGDQSPFPFTNSIQTCGFTGYRLLAEGDDGIIYTHYMTKEIYHRLIGKNYYENIPNPNVSFEDGDIFLSRKNDTNINFRFLLDRDNYEMISDWGKFKSQDLIYKVDAFGESWDYKWDYEFDSSDNIIGCVINSRPFGSKDFKVTIEYVYE